MARLSQSEFDGVVEELIAHRGLSDLRERLIRSNTVVSRRLLTDAASISRRLYSLTGGLSRDGVATQIVIALWDEFLGSKLSEEQAKSLEDCAERINGCLGSDLDVEPQSESALASALAEYRRVLAPVVGQRAAQLSMLSRAVPSIARRLREDPGAEAKAD